MTITALGIAAWGIVTGAEQQNLSQRFYQAIHDNDTGSLTELARHADLNVKDTRGATPLMYAAIFGTVEQLKLLLDAGADCNAKNSFGGTALICARGDMVKSQVLMEHGADANARSETGFTPLMAATGRGRNLDLARLLLARGSDAHAADKWHTAPLLLAASAGNVEVMRLLIDHGADVNQAGLLGLTPLGAAISSRRMEAVRLLLENGANAATLAMDDTAVVRNGPLALRNLTSLMLAAPYGTPEMIGALLKAGANVNAKDVRQMTPLMLAVASETQDREVVKLLLEAGAQVNEVSLSGETALDWANKFGNIPVISALKKAGAKTGVIYNPPDKPTAQARDLQEALSASIALLQKSSTEFFKQSGCVGCHHQPMAAMAVRAARRIGLAVDEQAAKEQLRVMSSQAANSQVRVLQSSDAASETDLGLAQGLREAEYPPDAITDSLVIRIATTQRLDGSWGRGPALSRAPGAESDIRPTVQAVRVLQRYSFPAARAAFEARIANARSWLLEQEPRTTDENAMLLLGLTWTSADTKKTRHIAKALLSQQRSDGGWGGNPNLSSDAYATGEALYALRESGFAGARGHVHQRGVRDLLTTQYPDGSWYVRSRAPKFQPYFQSGFPFGHDQWISAAATAWASTALAAEIEGK